MGDERRINQLTTKAYSDIGSSDYFAVDNASEAESKKLPVSAIKDGINDASTAASSAASTASTASTNATRALNIARSTSSFPTGDAYSSSSAYKVGDLVIYNNTLYRCKTACSAASWSTNASNFESISLASAITDLNNDLSTQANSIPKVKQSATLSFTITNYLGSANLASAIGVNKDRIVSIMPDSASGFGATTPTFVYSANDGKIYAYSSAASASYSVGFKVLYI